MLAPFVLFEIATIYKPKLLICGASAYPRDLRYDLFRKLADQLGCYLMCDMVFDDGHVPEIIYLHYVFKFTFIV